MSGADTRSKTLFALDFDGVLVDSAAETGQSGWLAAEILWPNASWMTVSDIQHSEIIDRFRRIRPCLETGWEAPLIIRLLTDTGCGTPSDEDIIHNFQSVHKSRMLKDFELTPEICNQALKQARDKWISQNNGQDWVDAHSFFEGACQVVRSFLEEHGSDNIYIITTKAKDFAIRLLEQQGLYRNDDSKIPTDHIYGLGSGPKSTVLEHILKEKDGDYVAIMVEDNLETLYKIMSVPSLQGRVTPVLASWGYNTDAQQHQATQDNFMVLDQRDSSTLRKAFFS